MRLCTRAWFLHMSSWGIQEDVWRSLPSCMLQSSFILTGIIIVGSPSPPIHSILKHTPPSSSSRLVSYILDARTVPIVPAAASCCVHSQSFSCSWSTYFLLVLTQSLSRISAASLAIAGRSRLSVVPVRIPPLRLRKFSAQSSLFGRFSSLQIVYNFARRLAPAS